MVIDWISLEGVAAHAVTLFDLLLDSRNGDHPASITLVSTHVKVWPFTLAYSLMGSRRSGWSLNPTILLLYCFVLDSLFMLIILNVLKMFVKHFNVILMLEVF